MSLKKIAFGTFSSVYTVNGKKDYYGFDGDDVVLKRNFANSTNSLMTCAREMDILLHNRHPFVVRLLHIVHCSRIDSEGCFSPTLESRGPSYREDDAHFIFPRASSDISSYIEKRPSARFSQLLSCQLLLGLEFLHSRGIVHRDIKPSNLLFYGRERSVEEGKENERIYHELVDPSQVYYGTLCISDFGFAKYHTPRDRNTPHIVTSWYRSPENCRVESYDCGVDVWSAACVMYELFFCTPLFPIPADAVNQNEAILHSIRTGHPRSDYELRPPSFLARSGVSENDIRTMCNQMHTTPEVFESVFQGMLQQNKAERCTITTILNSSYFDRYRRYISYYREKHNRARIFPSLRVHEEVERTWLLGFARNIFERKRSYPHMTTRIIFQIVSVYYRYIDYLHNKQAPKTVSNDTCGKYLTKKSASNLWDITCYIITNYHTFVHTGTPLSIFSSLTLAEARRHEINLYRDVTNRGIYVPTVYEEIDRMHLEFEEIDEFGLLIFYCCGKFTEANNTYILQQYLLIRDRMRVHLYNYFTSSEKEESFNRSVAIASSPIGRSWI